jgi:hypothetical protein
MATVTLAPILGGFALLVMYSYGAAAWQMVWTVLVSAVFVVSGWKFAAPWHIAMWELERRNDLEQEEKAARRNAQVIRRDFAPPIECDSSRWTGRAK